MDELNVAPSSTEPVSTTEPTTEPLPPSDNALPETAEDSAVGGGVDAPSHLLMLDVMLAEIERKIATGIHLFAHEVTAARDHLAKLL